MKILKYLLMFALFLFQLPAYVVYGAGEHPVIKPMPRSEAVKARTKVENYSSYSFRVKDGKRSKRIEKSGKFWKFRYLIKDADGKVDRAVSRNEIVRNYKEAALEKGGTIEYEVGYLLTFSVPRNDGGTTWAFLSAGNGNYDLYIIDEAGFKKQLTFGADEMKRQLDEKGRVAIYGIYFDTDKDNLKLGAEKILIEMVKLMKNNPDLIVEIQGHTDNTGSAEHNLDLSKRRAETVNKYLLLYGVAAAQMTFKGYGEEKPVAPNDTEENQALNRRVELKKLN